MLVKNKHVSFLILFYYSHTTLMPAWYNNTIKWYPTIFSNKLDSARQTIKLHNNIHMLNSPAKLDSIDTLNICSTSTRWIIFVNPKYSTPKFTTKTSLYWTRFTKFYTRMTVQEMEGGRGVNIIYIIKRCHKYNISSLKKKINQPHYFNAHVVVKNYKAFLTILSLY